VKPTEKEKTRYDRIDMSDEGVVTQGHRLYMAYEKAFAYRHPVPWDALPTTDERNLWERVASDFTRVHNTEIAT
jgi:hypothetical protein